MICMKCQTLFSGKNKKNIVNLSSAELAQRVVKVKQGSDDLVWICRLPGDWRWGPDHLSACVEMKVDLGLKVRALNTDESVWICRLVGAWRWGPDHWPACVDMQVDLGLKVRASD